MGKTEILRRIWLFSANKIKSSESLSKQPTQLIVHLNSSLRQIIDSKRDLLEYSSVFSSPVPPSVQFSMMAQPMVAYEQNQIFLRGGLQLWLYGLQQCQLVSRGTYIEAGPFSHSLCAIQVHKYLLIVTYLPPLLYNSRTQNETSAYATTG